MIRRTYEITYAPKADDLDPAVEIVDVLPVDILAVERAAGRQLGAVEETYRCVYRALVRNQLEDAAAGFDAWLVDVVSIERIRETNMDPTRAAAGPPR